MSTYTTGSPRFDYGARLQQAVQEDERIREFRKLFPEKFRALCFLQLSFIVDIPLELFHESDELDSNDASLSTFKRILSRAKSSSDGEYLFYVNAFNKNASINGIVGNFD